MSKISVVLTRHEGIIYVVEDLIIRHFASDDYIICILLLSAPVTNCIYVKELLIHFPVIYLSSNQNAKKKLCTKIFD